MASITPAQQAAITNLYVSLFNRAPDAAGFEFWSQALVNGVTLSEITRTIISSPEAVAIYPSSQTSEQFVGSFYQTVFGRAADAGGLTFWTNALNALGGAGSNVARAQLVSSIVDTVRTPLAGKPADLSDAQYAETVSDRATFSKKVVAGVDFAINAKSDDLSLAKQVIVKVTTPATPATPAAPPVPAVPVPDPFTLTTGTDTLLGSADNDTFLADNTNPAALTLTGIDTVNGGAGIDTLRYRAAAADTSLSLNGLTSVEKLYVQGGAALTTNISAIAGLAEAEFDAPGGALALIASGTQLVRITANNGNTVRDVSLAYGAGDIAAWLALNGSGKVGNASVITLAGAALGTLNVAAGHFAGGSTSGSASDSTVGARTNVVQLVDGGVGVLTKLNISGDRDISVAESISSLKEIDAFSATGNVSVNHSGSNGVAITTGAGADTITGGSGDDKIMFAAGKFTAADVVNGGAGRDTLQIRDATPDYAAINATTGIEVLGLAANAYVDVDQVANVRDFLVLGTGATSFVNAKNASRFVIGADANAVNISNAIGQTDADITLNDASRSSRVGIDKLTVTDASAISLTSLGSITQPNLIGDLVSAAGSVITIKGSAPLSFSLAGVEASRTVDASAFKGALGVSSSNFGDTIKLGMGANTVSGGMGNDIIIADNSDVLARRLHAGDLISGGLGTDTLRYVAAAADRDLILGTLNRIEKLHVSGGADLDINITAITGLVEAEFENLGGALYVTALAAQRIKLSGINGPTVPIVELRYGSSNLAADLVLNGVGKAGNLLPTIVTGVTTLNVSATGDDHSFVRLDSPRTLAALNISGDKNITIKQGINSLKTIDASAATGLVSVDASAAVPDGSFSFKGGNGGSVLTFGSGYLGTITSGAQLSAGSALTDKIVIGNTLLGTSEYTALNAASGFEILGVWTVFEVDASKLAAIKKFHIEPDSLSANITNITSGRSASIEASSNVVALQGSASDFVLNLGGGAITLGQLTIDGLTGISLVSEGTGANTITTLNSSDNAIITVSGDQDLTITNALGGVATGSKVDANGLTGRLNIIGSGKSDIIVGGSGDDTISGGTVTHAVSALDAVRETVMMTGTNLGAGQSVTVAGMTFSARLDGISTAVAFDKAFRDSNMFGGFSGSYTGSLSGYFVGDVYKTPDSDSVKINFYATSVGEVEDLTASVSPGVTAPSMVVINQGRNAQPAAPSSSDTLTGGTGADTFIFATADVDSVGSEVNAVITDFVSGTDRIKVTNGGTGAGSSTTLLKDAGLFGSLSALLAAADAALAGNIKYYVAQMGADSYLITDGDGIGYTNVIKLAGVSLHGIVASDLIA